VTTSSDVTTWLKTADRNADWSGVRACVAGLGRSGFAAADALLRVGAAVEVVESAPFSEAGVTAERAQILQTLGAVVRMGVAADESPSADLLVPSPGIPPHHRWITGPGVATVWSGEQLAWALRSPRVPWLTVTGTNGKTTTVQLLAAMLNQAGYRARAVGNIGVPLVEAVFADPQPDVLAVELSSFQLHFTRSVSAHSSALLNIAEDHLDWHGSYDAYIADKGRIFDGTERTIVYNHDDPATERLAEDAEVVEGCRAVGVTLGVPARSMVGVVDDVLVDRAFIADRENSAVQICSVAELPLPGRHNVYNVLAAAALARSFGATISSIRDASLGFALDAHRGEVVGVVDEVSYVDNSKATNVLAADVAIGAAEGPVVWIAGGLAKGGHFDSLIQRHRERLRAVVLMGADRAAIAEALGRHAPEIPVFDVADGDTEPMDHAVRAAAAAARPSDTVLLAPACASMDLFSDYQARGQAFRSAVAELHR
jgi:UDP-N-acetylmuramoylalanine--D-glutamate ligase